MAGIDSLGGGKPRPHLPPPTEAKKQQPQTAPTAQQYNSTYDQAVEMADDMSAVLSQFRRRTDMEKRSGGAADPFERILEGEAEPKVEQLFHIANSSEITPQALLLQARSMFPDDSDLILVLREIIRRRKLRNENTDVLEEVMQQVWAGTNEKYCKAGMNIGFKANLFSKKMAVTPWALRDTYRQFLTSEEGEISQYEQWVDQYGNVRRHIVLEFIEAALLHDIQSHDPSCSRAEFGFLLNHVVNFKKLRSSDKAFTHVFLKDRHQNYARKREKQGESRQENQQESDEEEAQREIEALACWFDCLQRPFKIKNEIEKNQLSQLMKSFKLPKPELQQKLLRAINLLDSELFFDPETKNVIIEALLNFDTEK